MQYVCNCGDPLGLRQTGQLILVALMRRTKVGQFLGQRILSTIVVLFGVSVLTFLMMHLIPGDPVQYLFASYQGEAPSPEQIEEVRRQLGLDKPLDVQYVQYLELIPKCGQALDACPQLGLRHRMSGLSRGADTDG